MRGGITLKNQNLPVIILKGMVLLPHNDLKIDLDANTVKDILEEAEMFHDGHLLIVNEINHLEENINLKELPNIRILYKLTNKKEITNNKIKI